VRNADEPATSDFDAGERQSAASSDLVIALNRLLVRALLELGRKGSVDDACRIAGESWVLLRHSHPREAERHNGLLHSLNGSRCAGSNH